MTAQQRIVIEPKDISGVEFECSRCSGRLFVPLNKFDGIPDRCPNCREIWFSALGAPDHVLFHDAVRHIKEIVDQVTKPRFAFRFEVTDSGDSE